jgi:hypothetical protein
MVSHQPFKTNHDRILLICLIQCARHACFSDYNATPIFAGVAVERDTPAKLLEDKSSLFSKLVAEYTMRATHT